MAKSHNNKKGNFVLCATEQMNGVWYFQPNRMG